MGHCAAIARRAIGRRHQRDEPADDERMTVSSSATQRLATNIAEIPALGLADEMPVEARSVCGGEPGAGSR
jgi:hypothetical protein